MARLIPKISIDEIPLKPERDVAKVLIEELPQDCIVYHSYSWLSADHNKREKKDPLHEGEADFVVIHPEYGFLVIEVKGGHVEFDSENHLWFRINSQGQKKQITDPFEQARKNTYYFKNKIQKISFPDQQSLSFCYGYAVILPDCEFSGQPPPAADRSIILSANDLPFLGRRVQEIFKKWERQSDRGRLSKIELNGILKGLSPSFNILPVLYRSIEEQEERENGGEIMSH